MYGETEGAAIDGLVAMGLSPHVRGNRQAAHDRHHRVGSIPACTGKPWKGRGAPPSAAVYPRMYGETPASANRRCAGSGLSPHVRGNRPRGDRGAGAAGSIPACTGKPTISRQSRRKRRVYPRMYGETVAGLPPLRLAVGLSPHVRGNQEQASFLDDVGGSIPACTGKPGVGRRGGNHGEVYPRMYGETVARPSAGNYAWGLSPHVRGNPPVSPL